MWQKMLSILSVGKASHEQCSIILSKNINCLIYFDLRLSGIFVIVLFVKQSNDKQWPRMGQVQLRARNSVSFSCIEQELH